MTIAVTADDIRLLWGCTANVDLQLDCIRALRGDTEALARCAKVIERAMPSADNAASYELAVRP